MDGSIKGTRERKNYKMNEIPTVKLTGRFPNTFSVAKEEGGGYSFQWDNDEEQTLIRVPLHGAIKLTEQFEKFGFSQINRK